MLKIKEIKTKTIIVKSGLNVDYVINPYIGCLHGCIYCYARFMKRFTNHVEPWGKFIDIKINGPDLILEKATKKYRNKSILISSVTDAYNPIEAKYKLTRKILEKLVYIQPKLEILTKSDLVLRDVDLLKKFKNCFVVISFSSCQDDFRKQLEPLAVSINRRVAVLKKLKEEGIKTMVFISPIFPKITDWQEIIRRTRDFVDEYWFENLNPYFAVRNNIIDFLRKNKPELINEYEEIWFKNNDYWDKEERAIKDFCRKNKLIFKIYFHHGK